MFTEMNETVGMLNRISIIRYDVRNAKMLRQVDEGCFYKMPNGNIILITWEMFENGLVIE